MVQKFFNTLTRKVEPFIPLEEGKVRFYACGPTVYHYAHIGNLRTYIFEDILRKTLEHAGFKVIHVMNVTDVGHLESDADEGDDKMELAAKREKKTPLEIARFYEEAFFEDLKKLNIAHPTTVCRATEHIYEMIEFIEDLKNNGFTYEASGNIYFNIDKFPTYAELSRRVLDELQEGARVDVDKNKQNPLDFVLWFTESKFKNQIMKWPSPFGVGFPGWHIECSTMASKYLGERIDIHAGGIDHISIHHSNEIAQSEARFGHKWVNVWMHGEFLVLKKEKMAKSAGNFLTLSSLIDAGYDPLHFRYLCLMAHYRSQLTYSTEALDGAKNAFETLKNRYLYLKHNQQSSLGDTEQANTFAKNFWKALDDDLNTPVALSIMWEMVKDQKISNAQKCSLLIDFDQVLSLGIKDFAPPKLNAELLEMIHLREKARIEKRYNDADDLREKLLSNGVCVKDTKQGPEWYLAYKD